MGFSVRADQQPGQGEADPPADTPALGALPIAATVKPPRELHPEHNWLQKHFWVSIGSNPGAGATILARQELGFFARSLIISNTSGSVLQIAGLDTRIPPGVSNWALRLWQNIDHFAVTVYTSLAGSGELAAILTDEELQPQTVFGFAAGE